MILCSVSGFSQITNISVLNESDSNGVLTHINSYYTIRGVVTTINLDPGRLQFYVQDATGGILLDKAASSGWYTSKNLAVGSDVTIYGQLIQYTGSGMPELTPTAESDITKNGTAALPTPQTITISDLGDGDHFALRGKLVRLLNVYKSTAVVDTWPTSGNNANNFIIAVGSVSATPTGIMRIDKDTDVDDNPEPTWPKDVTAIYIQYDASSPYTSTYELTPRAISDFIAVTPVRDWAFY